MRVARDTDSGRLTTFANGPQPQHLANRSEPVKFLSEVSPVDIKNDQKGLRLVKMRYLTDLTLT